MPVSEMFVIELEKATGFAYASANDKEISGVPVLDSA